MVGSDQKRVHWWSQGVHLTKGTVVLALFVVFAVLGALTVGYTRLADLYDKRASDMVSDRRQACKRFNQNQEAARRGQVNGFVAVLQQFGPAVRADVLAAVRKGAEDAAKVSFPYRNCTDSEIDNYLNRVQRDPAEGCLGDGHGYCKAG